GHKCQTDGPSSSSKTLMLKKTKIKAMNAADAEMASFFANIPPCLIGMEACAICSFLGQIKTDIEWAINVKLMAPQVRQKP
ncbi:hypothetical protein C0Q16_29035, partial [Klebsiella pneumoniae]